MKTTKMIAAVLAVFLALALFAGAASAAPAAGSVVYVYQYNAAATAVATPYYLWDGTTTTDIIFCDATGTFTSENIKEGVYSTTPGAAAGLFTVKYPKTTISGYLIDAAGATTSTSIAGKNLAKTESIRFIFDTPVAVNYGLSFTTPAGGTTNVFGKTAAGVDLSFDSAVTAPVSNGFVSNAAVTGVPLKDVATGEWSVKASLKTGTTALSQMTVITPSKYLSSEKLTFTVGSTVIDAISANKEKAIRGDAVLITLTGTPSSYVKVTINVDGLTLTPGQSGVKYVPTAAELAAGVTGPTLSGAFVQDFWVQLSSTGSRTVELDSTSTSPDKAYTIKALFSTSLDSALVALPAGHTDKTVKFTLEKGAVTASAAQASYFIGNDITLSGTNTESDLVYIFIKGSNVDRTYLLTVDVKSDDSWTTTFNPITAYGALDAGTYTFYAASAVDVIAGVNTFNSDFAYASTSVALKQPFLSGVAASSVVAKGDKIKITGTAEATNDLRYYVFGTNKFVTGTVSVADDATYTAEIETGNLAAGQYFVVIQHPMYDSNFNIGPASELVSYANGAFFDWRVSTSKIVIDPVSDVPSLFPWTAGDATVSGTAAVTGVYTFSAGVAPATGSPTAAGQTAKVTTAGQPFTILFDTTERQSANAAEALCQALDSQNIDDIYVKLTFIVAQPTMTMNPVSDVTKGSALKVSGTTNLKEGTLVTVDVLSTAFTAIEKTSVNSASFITLSTKVVKGADGVNTWEVTFDTTGLNVDTYTIQAATENLQTSAIVKVLEAAPTATATATATKTATATATATATPTKTPGFGAFLALAGLGAVAVLVLRRD